MKCEDCLYYVSLKSVWTVTEGGPLIYYSVISDVEKIGYCHFNAPNEDGKFAPIDANNFCGQFKQKAIQ